MPSVLGMVGNIDKSSIYVGKGSLSCPGKKAISLLRAVHDIVAATEVICGTWSCTADRVQQKPKSVTVLFLRLPFSSRTKEFNHRYYHRLYTIYDIIYGSTWCFFNI